jgi:hypothetical protein
MWYSLFLISSLIFGFLDSNEPYAEETHSSGSYKWENEIIELRHLNDSTNSRYMSNPAIFIERWDTLAQPHFWKKIMQLSPDSCVINIAKNRTIVSQFSINDWDKKSDEEKDMYRDSVRFAHQLSEEDKIYMTTGKSDFYAFDLVLPSISKGVEVFHDEKVDPWYAQAILLIESPGKIAHSNVGAYGPFQLMPSVARSHGLRVDKYVDERKDFVRSAQGASSLIHNTCLPHARRLLNERNISFKENDMWFRLFVLHIYHAGAYNVEAVLNAIQPQEGGPQLIQKMWQTSAGKFKNASQNYSQLALAALLILEDLLLENCEYLVAEK